LNPAVGFRYIDGVLHCDGVSAERIAERFGTPCYVYCGGVLCGRYAEIRDAFAPWDALVCFSVKSLSNLAVLRLLASEGSGFDVVSGGELYRVLRAGGDPARTVYAGVGKTAAEIEYALRSGVAMFNVESRGELRAIDRVARAVGRSAALAIRVNPDIDPNTHEKTTTGKKENKFGIGAQGVREAAAEAASLPGVELRGLHVHLGSPIYSPEPYRLALQKILELREQLHEAGCCIDVINIGGGYCISYTGEKVPCADDYARALEVLLEKLGCEVIIEPGRYISGPSGVLLVRVLYRKESEHGKKFIICDAGMNDLVRPTLYEAFHRIWPVRSPGGMPEVMRPNERRYGGFDTELVDVVGPVCESGDFVAQDRPLPPVQEGDLLAVFDAGAYGFTMSSNYNARPRAAEVLVREGEAALARQRETYEDLLRGEQDDSLRGKPGSYRSACGRLPDR